MSAKLAPERFKAAVEAEEERHRREIEDIADRAWGEVVMPTCREHKLDYMAGNGETFFVGTHKGEKVHIASVCDAEDKYDGAFEFLVPVFQTVIDVEVGRDDFLGYYIRDARFLP